MPRTTMDLDASVLESLKKAARAANKSMGDMASELLATVLRRGAAAPRREGLEWQSQAMGARVDLEDKDALHRMLDDR